MPTVIDNLSTTLLDELRKHIGSAHRMKVCVGFLNLKGWSVLGELIESFLPNPSDPPCRILVGMALADEGADPTLYEAPDVDGEFKRQRRAQAIENFRRQITRGIPTAAAEAALRRLARQLRSGSVRIRLFVRHPLHAKLYLLERSDPITPLVGYVGSSNLTLAGLAGQGELDVDVVEQDAARKLEAWFDARWNDSTLDISDELAAMIDASWAGEPIERIENLPYLIYLKVAYHLSENARLGAAEFPLPKELQRTLLDFQVSAVQLAAKLVQRYGGVLLGDVVGLGKTLMATALARLLYEADRSSTLVICPPRLTSMWGRYLSQYLHSAGAHARALSSGMVQKELPTLPRFATVILDESHNFRNRESKRYKAIAEYIEQNDPRVILLSATPFNKHYTDLANQLRLFLDDKQLLPAAPDRLLASWRASGLDVRKKIAEIGAAPETLHCFELSDFPDDWRDLMRHFMVRRTRSFIIAHYAKYDDAKQRHYVMLGGKPHYFPKRQPRTIAVPTAGTLYEQLYSERVVSAIERLQLPRYGLAQYLDSHALAGASEEHTKIAQNLTRAGKRLIGFARTNLFKRLESSGTAFLESVRRQMLRNRVVLYAIENGRDVPIGGQDVARIPLDPDDVATFDPDAVSADDGDDTEAQSLALSSGDNGKALYEKLRTEFADRFDWLPSRYFTAELARALENDNALLGSILKLAGDWRDDADPKLVQLYQLVAERHRFDKVLVFTQFADTARTIGDFLRKKGVLSCEVVTADTPDPDAIVRRFSPHSNGGLPAGEAPLRVLVATDTLSEGQNLQDCHIVVNFDLPWAIVRLIQRAGRVDRIGQQHDTITVYSFLPADGIEKIIGLRRRLRRRLQENQEVIGTDERFFDEKVYEELRDLYTEKAHVLDDSDDGDVDVTSYALQVWNSASEADRKRAQELPDQVYTSRTNDTDTPDGAIVFARVHDAAGRSDRLLRLDRSGAPLEHSLATIFDQLRCDRNTPSIHDPHVLDLVKNAAETIRNETTLGEGMLGSKKSLRRRLYECLSEIAKTHSTLAAPATFYAELVYRFPLVSASQSQLHAALKACSDEQLIELISELHSDGKFVVETEPIERRIEILCTVGLRSQR